MKINQSIPVLERFRPVLELMGQLTKQQRQLALAIYKKIADDGLVSPSELATVTGKSEAEIETYLSDTPGVYRDDAGSIIGFWGLTAQVSDHKVIFENKTRYAWCAWDTLFLPDLLGTTLNVQSKCAETQKPILLEISPTEVISSSSPNIVLSMLVPDESAFNKDVISSFCHHVHFFAAEEAGKRWAEDKEGIELLSLQDAFELGKMKSRYQYH